MSRGRESNAGSKTKERSTHIRIIGIDPGIASLGYGVIESSSGRLLHLTHGIIQTPSTDAKEQRLLYIRQQLQAVLARWKPTLGGMEGLYFWRNVSSALPVSEAMGVVRLTCIEYSIALVEYSPTVIKQAVLGSARAEKSQIKSMVKIILGLEAEPESDHAADALAIAICRATHGFPGLGE